jgi:hypothetical protein
VPAVPQQLVAHVAAEEAPIAAPDVTAWPPDIDHAAMTEDCAAPSAHSAAAANDRRSGMVRIMAA